MAASRKQSSRSARRAAGVREAGGGRRTNEEDHVLPGRCDAHERCRRRGCGFRSRELEHRGREDRKNPIDCRSVRGRQQIFAKITGLTEPNDAQGKPKTCTACKGEDKDKPIVGLVIIKDLSASGDRYKGGTILDPEDGKVYKAELWIEDGKLKVRGYLGMFYRTQTWLKVK